MGIRPVGPDTTLFQQSSNVLFGRPCTCFTWSRKSLPGNRSVKQNPKVIVVVAAVVTTTTSTTTTTTTTTTTETAVVVVFFTLRASCGAVYCNPASYIAGLTLSTGFGSESASRCSDVCTRWLLNNCRPTASPSPAFLVVATCDRLTVVISTSHV